MVNVPCLSKHSSLYGKEEVSDLEKAGELNGRDVVAQSKSSNWVKVGVALGAAIGVGLLVANYQSVCDFFATSEPPADSPVIPCIPYTPNDCNLPSQWSELLSENCTYPYTQRVPSWNLQLPSTIPNESDFQSALGCATKDFYSWLREQPNQKFVVVVPGDSWSKAAPCVASQGISYLMEEQEPSDMLGYHTHGPAACRLQDLVAYRKSHPDVGTYVLFDTAYSPKGTQEGLCALSELDVLDKCRDWTCTGGDVAEFLAPDNSDCEQSYYWDKRNYTLALIAPGIDSASVLPAPHSLGGWCPQVKDHIRIFA